MASGTGERPLGTPGQEKALLGFTGNMKLYGMEANTTYYLHLDDNANKYGLFFMDGAANTKRAMGMYGAGTNSSLHYTPIVSPTQSGTSVTPSASGKTGRSNYLKIINGANYAYAVVYSYIGVLPVLTTTEPT